MNFSFCSLSLSCSEAEEEKEAASEIAEAGEFLSVLLFSCWNATSSTDILWFPGGAYLSGTLSEARAEERLLVLTRTRDEESGCVCCTEINIGFVLCRDLSVCLEFLGSSSPVCGAATTVLPMCP